MKFLINDSFTALRSGDFVIANEDAGEFIFDSEKCNFSAATICEIAEENGLKINSKQSKSDLVKQTEQQLIKLELPTMNELTQTEKIAQIVSAGVAEGKSDDDMLIEIVQSGVKFKQAGKLFNAAMEDGGYRITNKKRKEQGREILIDAEFSPDTYEQYQEMILHIVDQVADTTESQANSIAKSYAKEFEIELPKPPKKVSGGIKLQIVSWIKSNPGANRDEMLAFIESKGPFKNPDRATGLADRYAFVLDVANHVNNL